ncbi:ribosome maturation factor RimM [Metallibacterium scheffleri]|uniref:Ribosome maturation factor RimM n=1 Tax=Metallibacterium scheffleri TaxID=993689 RepID=A0A4S3KSK1_9GAMM|nr:ribosome maturation factor RimM [Metallibacterium scheffleri]THD12095.1 ribosome maturation factor RimM [Metallibacterium scheffleri]
MSETRWVVLGRVVGQHGLRGELKLFSYTAPPERIFDYRVWRLKAADGREIELKRINGRVQGKALIVSLPGVLDRDAALAWMDAEVSVARAALPPLAQGEFYWADLEGLEVVTLEGVSLGKVSHLLSTGANDVMVVRDAERERLLPFVPGQWVQQVDLAAGRIVVDWDPAF